MTLLGAHAVGDPDAMRALARGLAADLRAGDLLVLDGPLGAGKTVFVQGLADGLGVRGRVTSPTFVIARVHPSTSGGPGLVHVDAYRLPFADGVDPRDALDDLDLDTDLASSVVAVEWGEGLVEQLSADRLLVRIDRPSGEAPDDDPAGGSRTVTLTGVGPRWA